MDGRLKGREGGKDEGRSSRFLHLRLLLPGLSYRFNGISIKILVDSFGFFFFLTVLKIEIEKLILKSLWKCIGLSIAQNNQK